MPRFDAGDGRVKVPAAWLIEHAGFGKGYGAPGRARVSSKHTLALVNAGGATTAGLLALAREIGDGVHAAFGVTLTPNPSWSASPCSACSAEGSCTVQHGGLESVRHLVRAHRARHRHRRFQGLTGFARIVHDDEGAYVEINLA